MILSNQHVNLNNAHSATIQLGDTLGLCIECHYKTLHRYSNCFVVLFPGAKGDVFGAHFCYLAIQTPLESIGLSSKFTLLGSSSNQSFNPLATNRAILLTSAYEFSMRLNLSYFHISSLLVICDIN